MARRQLNKGGEKGLGGIKAEKQKALTLPFQSICKKKGQYFAHYAEALSFLFCRPITGVGSLYNADTRTAFFIATPCRLLSICQKNELSNISSVILDKYLPVV